MPLPLRVTLTGAAGHIASSLLFRIASGEMFGKNQPIFLQLLDLPQAQKALAGIVMELEDCAFPLLSGVLATDDPSVAFKDSQAALLVGARPRGPGMERKDLLTENARIFKVQGDAIGRYASPDCRVLVVGNPCHTNAYIAKESAKKHGRVPVKNFTALQRLDHNRALSLLAAKTGRPVSSIKGLIVWGNHSPAMYADYRFATSTGQSLQALIQEEAWNEKIFLPTLAKRGNAIIKARGFSSVESAANAAIDHMRDWFQGTAGEWVTMAVPSDGSYGIPAGLVYGFPVIIEGGEYRIVQGLEIDAFSREKMNVSLHELEEERAEIADLLN